MTTEDDFNAAPDHTSAARLWALVTPDTRTRIGARLPLRCRFADAPPGLGFLVGGGRDEGRPEGERSGCS